MLRRGAQETSLYKKNQPFVDDGEKRKRVEFVLPQKSIPKKKSCQAFAFFSSHSLTYSSYRTFFYNLIIKITPLSMQKKMDMERMDGKKGREILGKYIL
jgi:hypothetical protein